MPVLYPKLWIKMRTNLASFQSPAAAKAALRTPVMKEPCCEKNGVTWYTFINDMVYCRIGCGIPPANLSASDCDN